MDEAVLLFVFERGQCAFQNRFRARVALNDHTGWCRPGAVMRPIAVQLFFDQLKRQIPAEIELAMENERFTISFASINPLRFGLPKEPIILTADMVRAAHESSAPDTPCPTLVEAINLDGVHAFGWLLGAWYNAQFALEVGPEAIKWIPPRASYLPPSSRRRTSA